MDNEKERLEELYESIITGGVDKKVEKVVCYILEKEGCTHAGKTLHGNEIQEKYAQLKKADECIVSLKLSTISTMTSNLANKSSSPINCPGKKQGYYVSLFSNEQTDEEGDTTTESGSETKESTNHKQLEKKLYPIVKSWLASIVDRVEDISISRGSTKWRNPDILGINFKNLLGNEYIELITIEVKPSMNGWQQYIFEAVSHYMFVHKSYFAFLHPVEEKIPEMMKLYANQFGIGLISIEFSRDDWDKFLADGTIPDAEDYDIIEVAPSLYHVPNIDLESEFLKGLNISSTTELHKFGESSENLE